MKYSIKDLKYLHILNLKQLEINRGMTVISGASGCGKSTLVKLLKGQDYDYAGSIMFDEIELKSQSSSKYRTLISSLSQDAILLGETVKEEFIKTSEVLELEYNKAWAKQCLSLANFDLGYSEPTAKLSGGQKQRLLIARTLYIDKPIIMLDEPTSSLDEESTKVVFENLLEYCQERNKMMVLISHDPTIIGDSRVTNIDMEVCNDN